MKKIFTITSCLLLCVGLFGTQILQAQSSFDEDITVPLSDPSAVGTLEIYNHNGKISVEGYDGKEVIVSIRAFPGEKSEHKSKDGLKRIPNQSLDVDIIEEDNVVEIDGGKKRTDFFIKVPKKFSLDIGTHHNGEVYVKNVDGEMIIDCHHGGMKLENVSGSLVADTHHGEIKANFISISDRPMAFSTYHGDVDITLPASTQCNVKIKSERGDVFTDFEVDMKALRPKQKTEGGRREILLGGWMEGAIGSGGKEMMFNTYHGDVIIRKS